MNAPLRVLVAGLLASSALVVTARASAEPATPATPAEPAETTAAPDAPRESSVQLHLDAAAGVSTAGALASGLGLVRIGVIEVGGSVTSSGLFSSRTGGGLAIGGGQHRAGGGGFDVLFELGVNEQHVTGSGGLLSSDPGASGAVPYAGLRGGIDWSFGKPSAVVRPTLGLWLFMRSDLGGRRSSYAYEDRGIFSSRTETSTGSATLGGGGEIGLALAGGFDILP